MSLVLPLTGFEQRCNAFDAQKAGAGLFSTRFDVGRFLDYLPGHNTPPDPFRAWVGQAREKMLREIESAAGGQVRSTRRLGRTTTYATRCFFKKGPPAA